MNKSRRSNDKGSSGSKKNSSEKKSSEIYRYYFNQVAKTKQKVEKISESEWDELRNAKAEFMKVEDGSPVFIPQPSPNLIYKSQIILDTEQI